MAGSNAGHAGSGRRAFGTRVLSWVSNAKSTRPGRSFVGRIIRASLMEPSLYREVASPGASSRQATLVLVLAAGGAGLGGSARTLLQTFVLRDLDQWTGYFWSLFAKEAVPIAVLGAVAHLFAWPVWAAAMWIIGGRLASPKARAVGYWPVARALAYAQSPTIFLLLSPIFIRVLVPVVWLAAAAGSDPSGVVILDMSLLRTLDFGVRTLISAWVLIGTFLAMRETLGLSNSRTLGALLAAAAAVAVVLGVLAAAVSLAVPPPAWDFDPASTGDKFLGVGGQGPLVIFPAWHAIPITIGLDFNLGLIDAFMVFITNLSSFRFFP